MSFMRSCVNTGLINTKTHRLNKMTTDDWFTCPICGEVVQLGSLACPGCGADDETGWSEAAEYDDLGLDDEAFGDPPPKPTRQVNQAFTVMTVVLVIVIFVVWVIGGF